MSYKHAPLTDDEAELEPLNTDHILFPNMFLGGGLFVGFLTFLLETRGLREQRGMLRARFPSLPRWFSKR